jgi:hypothetical protein
VWKTARAPAGSTAQATLNQPLRPEQARRPFTEQNPMNHSFDLSCVADLRDR